MYIPMFVIGWMTGVLTTIVWAVLVQAVKSAARKHDRYDR